LQIIYDAHAPPSLFLKKFFWIERVAWPFLAVLRIYGESKLYIEDVGQTAFSAGVFNIILRALARASQFMK
jgi:hypothetical protein